MYNIWSVYHSASLEASQHARYSTTAQFVINVIYVNAKAYGLKPMYSSEYRLMLHQNRSLEAPSFLQCPTIIHFTYSYFAYFACSIKSRGTKKCRVRGLNFRRSNAKVLVSFSQYNLMFQAYSMARNPV